jgi:transposase, IS5 family
MFKEISFFAEGNRLERLSQLGDNLEKLDKAINWEIFRDKITSVFNYEKNRAGRPPFDYIVMFKILVLQSIYNLSDEAAEFQCNDRLTFMRFLDLNIAEKVPDAKTIWHFRECLKNANIINDLFAIFYNELEKHRLITHKGSIIDATFTEVPRQRNDRDENKSIKNNKVPDGWDSKENINMLRQKDLDARWTIKNDMPHYGYKDHIKVDKDSKLIVKCVVTSANVHDSQMLNVLLDDKDKVVYADSAYAGVEIENKNIKNKIHEKAYRNKPLTEEQQNNNKIKTKIRCRVEHVFGFIKGNLNKRIMRSIGQKRAEFNIILSNMVYNFCRYTFLVLRN